MILFDGDCKCALVNFKTTNELTLAQFTEHTYHNEYIYTHTECDGSVRDVYVSMHGIP